MRTRALSRTIAAFTVGVSIVLSCRDYRSDFESLVSIKEFDDFPSLDFEGEKSIDNRHYQGVYRTGKKANAYLLEKAVSKKKTRWTRASLPVSLTEGDITLILLMDINSIIFERLIPEEIQGGYDNYGAVAWWQWLHENETNRKFVIDRIKGELLHRDER